MLLFSTSMARSRWHATSGAAKGGVNGGAAGAKASSLTHALRQLGLRARCNEWGEIGANETAWRPIPAARAILTIYISRIGSMLSRIAFT